MSSEEDVVERLLNATGPREPLPVELKERWSTHFQTELRATIDRRRRRRIGAALVSVGAAAVVTFVVWIMVAPTRDVLVARIVEVTGQVWNERAPLKDGGVLAVGDELRTSSDGRIAFVYRGADLRCDVDTTLRLGEDEIDLVRGSLYVDAPRGAGNVRVKTPFGVVSHLGTQFIVSVQPALMTAAVREGRIAVSTDGQIYEFAGDRHAAVHVEVAGGQVISTSVPSHDGAWAWVNTVAPAPSFEGRPASALLEWYARETGRTLRYMNDRAHLDADVAHLYGISDLAVDEVPSVVAAITRLDVTLSEERATVEVAQRSKGE